MDGELGKYIRTAIEKAGVYALEGTWDSSFHQVFNNVRPINSPDDLRGLKIRVPATPIWVALFRGFGASPIPTAFSDTYTALQTHLIDGAELAYSNVASAKFYEVLKFASETKHAWTGLTIVANPGAWQRLPKKLRDIVEHRLLEASRRERVAERDGEAKFLAQLRRQGMVYNQPDLAPFRMALRKAGLYDQWRSSFGTEAWTALEKTQGISL